MATRAAIVLLVAFGAFALVGCDSSGGADPSTASSATSDNRPLSFASCNSVSDNDVAAAVGRTAIGRAFTSPMGCQWESDSAAGEVDVRAWWFRGASLTDARKAAIAAGRTTADIDVDGLAGFTARATDGTDCAVEVGRGIDFVSWRVNESRPSPSDLCGAADRLAQLSASRAVR